ncbi:MAG TPA: hypothetical protein VNT03_07800 [Baekduia sp.]|nr:hypothetical protein [Baekduia sp.]
MADALGSHAVDGTVMTQLAACRRAAGVALLRRPAFYELRGRGPDLDAVATRLLGGASPAPGRQASTSWGWWVRESEHGAVAAADVPRGAELAEALAGARRSVPDIAIVDRAEGHAAIVIAGPRAGRVAVSAADLLIPPVACFDDGDDYHLVIVQEARGLAAFQTVLAAGRQDGAVAVGLAAVGTLRAARRVIAGQRPAPRLRPSIKSQPGVTTS